MRDVDPVVFRPVAERRTRLWAWRVPGRETLGEAGTQSLATSQDHPPIPHLLWGCPAPPPGPVPQLGGSGGGDPPAQTPPWARSSAFAWLLGRAASLAPRRGGLEGERRTEKQIRGWGLARSRPALTARAPTLCCLPASTSFSAEWVPPPQLPSLRAGRRHGVRTALSLGWGDGCCCEK